MACGPGADADVRSRRDRSAGARPTRAGQAGVLAGCDRRWRLSSLAFGWLLGRGCAVVWLRVLRAWRTDGGGNPGVIRCFPTRRSSDFAVSRGYAAGAVVEWRGGDDAARAAIRSGVAAVTYVAGGSGAARAQVHRLRRLWTEDTRMHVGVGAEGQSGGVPNVQHARRTRGVSGRAD